MQFICLKQLRSIIIETPMVIAKAYLCIQMIKGSWLSLCCPIYSIRKKVKNFLMKKV